MAETLRTTIRRYAGLGIASGLLAGAVEATTVHRPGTLFIPFAAFAYGVMLGLAFFMLGLAARILRRNLLPVALAALVLAFVGLEAGFWVNARTAAAEESTGSTVGNILVMAAALGLGGLTFALIRRRPIPDFWSLSRWLLLVAGAVMVGYFGLSGMDSQPGPNCVLVSIDALRADHLACYGYARNTSPNIDGLAAKGTLWERAYTQSPGSTGGHASMLTGLYTLSHGAYLNGFRLDDRVATLAEVFRNNGYATAAFINNWYLSPALGFGQGFDCFVDGGKSLILEAASPSAFFRGLVLYQVIHRFTTPPGAPSDLEIVDALSWIRWRARSSFFVFLHIMDPHSPYMPPAETLGRLGGQSEQLSPDYIEGLHAKSLEGTLTPEEGGFLVDRYDEEIMNADRKVGMLVRELGRLGLLERTLIVVTTDHGEVMAEGGDKHFGHGTLDMGCLRVPLIISFPGIVPEGRVDPTIAQSIDIVPTITALLDLRDDAPRQGLSLFTAEMDSLGPLRVAFSTGDIEAGADYAVVTYDWQYRITGQTASLYRIEGAACPGESVLSDYPSVADSLNSLIEEWIDRSIAEAVVPFSIEGRSVAPGREALKRLKAVGYIQ